MFDESCIGAEVLLDSVNPSGGRVTTVVVTIWRSLLAEFNTHRAWAKSANSSRAIPLSTTLRRVEEDPFLPLVSLAHKGMCPSDFGDKALTEEFHADLRDEARRVVQFVKKWEAKGIAKSVLNRYLEVFTTIRVVATFTECANLFRLRRHGDAEPHFQLLADKLYHSLKDSDPVPREVHLPYLTMKEESDAEAAWRSGDMATVQRYAEIAMARCARISYDRDSDTSSAEADASLITKLKTGSGFGHWVPSEHPALYDKHSRYDGKSCLKDCWTTARAKFYPERENLAGHVDAYDYFLEQWGEPELSYVKALSAALV